MQGKAIFPSLKNRNVKELYSKPIARCYGHLEKVQLKLLQIFRGFLIYFS